MKAVKTVMKDRRLELAHSAPSARPAPPHADVCVIFTTPQATRAALQAADAITPSGESRIHFLIPQVVPMGFPLDRPPVSVAFAEQRAAGMARECCRSTAVQVRIVLCGDRDQCLERTLSPNSLVMIGSRKQPWLASEQKLARRLRAMGHRVIHVLEQ
jgi:hypothetical protein